MMDTQVRARQEGHQPGVDFIVGCGQRFDEEQLERIRPGDFGGSIFRNAVVVSGAEHFDFSDALGLLRAGETVSRTGWMGLIEITLQQPGPQSMMTEPYLYISDGVRRVAWQPSQQDLFADDWFVVQPTGYAS